MVYLYFVDMNVHLKGPAHIVFVYHFPRGAEETAPAPGKDQPALDNMLRLFSMLISFVVTREYIKVRRPGLGEQTVRWVEDHITEPVSLDDIAAARVGYDDPYYFFPDLQESPPYGPIAVHEIP